MSEPAAATNTTITATTSAPIDKPIVTSHNFPSNVNVRFITNTYPEKVAETTFKVPADFSRLGLSELVNHLLNHETPVPFEFLVEFNGKKYFLRQSLKKFFIKTQQFPEETILTLEYIEATPSPKQVDSIPHDDWVSALDTNADYLLTGCYDGVLRLFQDNQLLATAKHIKDAGPVKSIASTMRQDEGLFVCTATNDEHVRLWKMQDNKFYLQSVMKGHKQGVNAICFNPKGNMAVSVSNDKSILLWDVFFKGANKDEIAEPDAKKMKLDVYTPRQIATLSGHILEVTCAKWADQGLLYTGSKDHTIRVWDIMSGTNTVTLQGSKVVTCMAQQNNMILSGHPDFLIRLWDVRTKSNKATLFKSHKQWVRSVEWRNEYQFASGADDNLVKLWDIRSGLPLHSVAHFVQDTNAQQQAQSKQHKVLAVKWHAKQENQLYSGSTDCTVKRHLF